jgi:hypothetical protein
LLPPACPRSDYNGGRRRNRRRRKRKRRRKSRRRRGRKSKANTVDGDHPARDRVTPLEDALVHTG